VRAATHDFEFICDDNNQFIGINLGWDFCAEHEWGIKKIKQHFGIPLDVKEKDNWGIKSRTITHFPEKDFTFQIIQDYIILLFENHVNRKNYFTSLPEFKKYSQRYELNLNCLTDKDPKYIKEVVTAWNEDSFGIVTTKEHESKMNELFEAFKKKRYCNLFCWKK